MGDRVSIGSNATLLPVTICSDVVIGAGATVTKDITQPGIYAGNPARLMRQLPPTTLLDVKISLADAQKNIEALNSVAAIACREHADCLSSGAQFGPIITAIQAAAKEAQDAATKAATAPAPEPAK